MRKPEFGDLIRTARQEKEYSLRSLADRVGMEYSRLARIESGDRPPPSLSDVRRLAQILELNMVDLLVSAGTPREVVEHLLWSERLQAGTAGPSIAYPPEQTLLLEKNTYDVPVVEKDWAACKVRLGEEVVRVFSFASGDTITITIPPEAVIVFAERPASSSMENVFEVRVKKLRFLGQVTNLVLEGRGFQLNSLHGSAQAAGLQLAERDLVYAGVQSTAIHTQEQESREENE